MPKAKPKPEAWANRIVKSGELPAHQFLAHPLNARRHPGAQRDALRGSLDAVGWVAPVIVSTRSGKMLDGHARIEEALSRNDEQLIPYVEVDVSEDEERLILASFDPITSLATYDKDALETLLADLNVTDGLKALLDDLAAQNGLSKPTGGGGDEFDTTPDDGPTRCQQGDLWVIGGKHRLVCGDATDAATVARLTGDAQIAIVSDPPYGIGVDTRWLSTLHIQRGKPPNKSDDRLQNDDGSLDIEWMFEHSQWLVFGFPYVARQSNYTGLLVWDKRGDGGENGLGNPIEVAASNAFTGYRLSRHIWAGYVREAGEHREAHPTQKPVKLMQDAICLIKNAVVFDPFLGSGTTLIAAHREGRTCYGLEIAPRYCDVILKRAEAEGLECEKAEEGSIAETTRTS